MGARFELAKGTCVIGRARTASLVLRDPGVSRRHVEASVASDRVELMVCDGAAPMLVAGRAVRKATAAIGDRFVIGSTLIEVKAPREDQQRPSSRQAVPEMGTILTGVGAEARAGAALHALIDGLDAVSNPEALEAALATWGRELTPPCEVRLRYGTPGPSAESAGMRVVPISAPSEEPAWLEVTFGSPLDESSGSTQRMLVLAGRLTASALARTRRLVAADGEVAALRTLSYGSSHEFLGTSPAARQLAARLPKLAGSDVSVLLEGETGVGKTFVARLIHEEGPRAKEPFRVINCAAIPEALLESELFGHERGAFTGALAQRTGALEAAGRGTVFLDEVGELSMASQAKLLRVLEDKRFERIGSNRTLEFRARLLCATNRDLERMIERGEFRRDLLFRIAVIRERVPSLRERREDLPELARQFLADAMRSAGRRVDGFSAAALEQIVSHPWPGNVRELRNAIEHAVALGEGTLVEAGDLPAGTLPVSVQPADADLVQLPASLADVEQRAIASALRHTGGNKTKAAALLGISRPTLHAKLSASKE